jgi:hypothetical protein
MRPTPAHGFEVHSRRASPPALSVCCRRRGSAILGGLVLSAALAPCAAGQNHWIVDAANGPGSHFNDLPAAVAAAAPGARSRCAMREAPSTRDRCCSGA